MPTPVPALWPLGAIHCCGATQQCRYCWYANFPIHPFVCASSQVTAVMINRRSIICMGSCYLQNSRTRCCLRCCRRGADRLSRGRRQRPLPNFPEANRGQSGRNVTGHGGGTRNVPCRCRGRYACGVYFRVLDLCSLSDDEQSRVCSVGAAGIYMACRTDSSTSLARQSPFLRLRYRTFRNTNPSLYILSRIEYIVSACTIDNTFSV